MRAWFFKLFSRDVSWAYLAQGVAFLFSLFFIPFLLRTLSSQEIGLWYLYIGIMGFTSLFDFGFGPTLTRNMTYAHSGVKEIQKHTHAEEKLEGANVLLMHELRHFSFTLYRFLGLAFILIAFPAGAYYFYKLKLSLEPQLVFISAFIFFVTLLLNFLWQPYNFIVVGLKKVREYNMAIIVARLVYVITGVIAVSLWPCLITLTLVYLLNTLTERLMMRAFAARAFDFSKTMGRLSWERTKELFSILFYNSSRHGLCALGGYLSFRVNILIAGAFLSLYDISSFGLAGQVLGLINAFSMSLLTTKVPKISAELCLGNRKEALRIFSYSWVLGLLMYAGAGFFVTLFAHPLLELIGSHVAWMKTELFFFLTIVSFMEFNCGLFMNFLVADNHIPYTKSVLLTGLVSTLLTFILLAYFQLGLLACVLSFFLSQILYNNWYWPRYFAKRYQVKLGSLLREGFAEFWRGIR